MYVCTYVHNIIVPFLIRLSRQTGVRLEEDLETTDGIFDYVTEDDYFKLVQERQQDQWIMDDGVCVCVCVCHVINHIPLCIMVLYLCRWDVSGTWT